MHFPVAARLLLVATLCLRWRAVTGAYSTAAAIPAFSEKRETLVVRSTSDAVRMSRCASRDGAVVHVSWIGSVVMDEPIKVWGLITRLQI